MINGRTRRRISANEMQQFVKTTSLGIMMTSLAAAARDLGTGRCIQWSRSMLIDFVDGAIARIVHYADEVLAQEWCGRSGGSARSGLPQIMRQIV